MAKSKKVAGKKKNNTLSTRSIFGNKGAKSQAKQIYALNKKMKKMYKEIAPEIKINNSNLFNKGTAGLIPSNGLNNWDRWDALFKDNLNNQMRPGYNMQGKLMRIRNIKLFGSFGFSQQCPEIRRDNPFAPSYTDIAAASYKVYDVAYLRIIVCQLKKGGAAFPTKITQNINTDTTVPPTIQDLSPINGPLVEGVTGSFNILKQKIIKIDNKTPYKSFSINLKKSFTYRINADTGNHFDSNDIIIFTQYVCPQVFRIVNNSTTPATEAYMGPFTYTQLNFKVSFVDQD